MKTKYPLDQFKTWLLKQQLSVTTTNQYLSYVRRVLTACLPDRKHLGGDPEFVSALLDTTPGRAAWRQYRTYQLERQASGTTLPFVPAELARGMEQNHQPRAKQLATVDLTLAFATSLVLDALVTAGMSRKDVINLTVGDVAWPMDNTAPARLRVGVLGNSPLDNRISVAEVAALRVLTGDRPPTAPLLVSPWTGNAATWAEWQQLDGVTSEVPIPFELRTKLLQSASTGRAPTEILPPVEVAPPSVSPLATQPRNKPAIRPPSHLKKTVIETTADKKYEATNE